MNKEEAYRKEALQLANRISGGKAKDKPWYLLLLIPSVLIAGLILSPNSWVWAIAMAMVALIFFFVRMQLWKTGNQKLELIFFIGGTFIILAPIVYMLITKTFEWGKLLIVLGGFYSMILIARTVFTTQINQISKDLIERYSK
ncbi:hypothetical protein GCM10022393_19890 [Aquimarina addita]|uniref:Uncharacterized protein n=1 Tax=Aquimarina addita TaxID=870485 RepID=A0ABP6ULH6_9FLAO